MAEQTSLDFGVPILPFPPANAQGQLCCRFCGVVADPCRSMMFDLAGDYVRFCGAERCRPAFAEWCLAMEVAHG